MEPTKLLGEHTFNMKFIKLLLLPLLAGCALAQTTPIYNPNLQGTVTFSSSPSVTGCMTYVDSSNHLQPLALGSGLALTGGTLTVNTGNGGGGGGGSVFTTLQVGTDVTTNAIPINFSPLVTAIGNSAKALRLSPTINNTASGDVLYGIATGGTIQSLTPYTNVNYYHELIGTPTLAGYVTLNSATAIYISPSPTATNKYGIVQAGPNDLNTFAGKVSFADGSYISSSNVFFQSNVNLAVGATLNVNTALNANNLNIVGNSTIGPVGPSSYALTVNTGYPNGSISISPYATSGTTGMLYTNNSGTLSVVNVGAGLQFIGGTLSNTGGGGGGGGGISAVNGTTNQINAITSGNAVTLSTPQNIDTAANTQFGSLGIGVAGSVNNSINIQPTVTVSGGQYKGLRVSPVVTQSLSGDTIYDQVIGGTINANGNTGGTFFELDLGSPTMSGSFTTAYQLYLGGFATGTFSNKYGIYQGGTEPNVLSGSLQVPSLTIGSLNGYLTASGGLISTTSTIPTSALSGSISVPNGGTGASSLTGYVYGNGTSAMTASTTIPTSALSGTINNSQLANNSVNVNAGTGLSGGGNVALGSSITLSNAGVTSLAGTSNQVNVSSSTGGVTLSTPQNIDTGANVQFNSLTLGTSYLSNIGFDLQTVINSGGSSGGGAKGARISPLILANGNNDTIYGVAQGGTLAVSTFSNLNYYEYDIGAPTITGTGSITNATQLFLAGFGSTSVSITNKYGIYQAGTETNVFKGIVVLPHTTVAGLPSASTVQYGEAFVTDSTQSPGTSIGSTVSGGGSYIRKVYSDGSNWILE